MRFVRSSVFSSFLVLTFTPSISFSQDDDHRAIEVDEREWNDVIDGISEGFSRGELRVGGDDDHGRSDSNEKDTDGDEQEWGD